MIAAQQTFRSIAEVNALMKERFSGKALTPPDEPIARARDCLARTVRPGIERALKAVLVDEALDLDPGNADALRLVADRESNPMKRIPALERAITAARDRMGGESAVARLRGATWGEIAARPYLRARGRLAETLIEAGRVAEAITECEALLDLDESDALAVRHRIGTLYLAANKPGAFRRLTKRFEHEESGFSVWGHVLAALLSNDEEAARDAHTKASRVHGGVAVHMLTPWTDPVAPDHYALGEHSETLVVAHELYPAFCAHPTALSWLLARTPRVKPRSNRIRRLLESLRPDGSQDPEPRWLAWLLRSGGHPPPTLAIAVRLEGDRAIPWIVSMLENDALDRKGAPGSGYGPTSAARLLGELEHPAALEPLALALAKAEPESALSGALLTALGRYGPSALEPLLAARTLVSASDPEGRDGRLDDVCDSLSRIGARDDRVFEALRCAFEREPGLGAAYFATYGDPRAVPILSAWIDGRRIDVSDGSTLSNMGLMEVLAAIRELGGSLTAPQEALRLRIDDLRFAIHLQLISDERSGRRIESSSDPGGDDADDGDVADDGDEDRDDLDAEFDDDETDGGSLSFPEPLRSLDASASFGVSKGTAADDRFQTAGRNAPCPCGSGKKFKKCCWDTKRGG